jgi:hypothetical protein
MSGAARAAAAGVSPAFFPFEEERAAARGPGAPRLLN